MRAEALLLVLLAARPAAAQDAGEPARLGPDLRVAVRASGRSGAVLFELTAASAQTEPWNAVLVQGELPDPGVRVQVQREGDAAWRDLELRRSSGGRFWGKALLPRGLGRLRLRGLDGGVSAPHELVLYSAETFDQAAPAPAPAPAPPPARGPMDAAAPMPPVHGRGEWNAAPPAEPYTPDPLPWRVTIHHSAGRQTTTLADSLVEARFIQDMHQHGRGWNDIGYHYLIDAAGNVLEGRPLGALGSHTLSNNEGNVGIVLLGDFQPPSAEKPTQAQLDAAAALGRWLVRRFGIDPGSLKGHRDYKATECPGDRLYARLPALRAALASQAGVATRRRGRKVVVTAPADWVQVPVTFRVVVPE